MAPSDGPTRQRCQVAKVESSAARAIDRRRRRCVAGADAAAHQSIAATRPSRDQSPSAAAWVAAGRNLLWAGAGFFFSAEFFSSRRSKLCSPRSPSNRQYLLFRLVPSFIGLLLVSYRIVPGFDSYLMFSTELDSFYGSIRFYGDLLFLFGLGSCWLSFLGYLVYSSFCSLKHSFIGW